MVGLKATRSLLEPILGAGLGAMLDLMKPALRNLGRLGSHAGLRGADLETMSHDLGNHVGPLEPFGTDLGGMLESLGHYGRNATPASKNFSKVVRL